jgi:hypothetical protein
MAVQEAAISQLPNQLSAESNIAWQFSVGPYTDQEQIRLNIGRTERLLHVAGLGGLVIAEHFGEQSVVQAEVTGISGVNGDGSATAAGSARVARARTERVTLQSEDEAWLAPEFRWPVATVDINRTEFASRVADRMRNRQPPTREEAAASELDRSIRRGIWSASRENLLAGNPLTVAGSALIGVSITQAFSGEFPTVWTIATALSVGAGLMRNKRDTGQTHWERRRWSLFPAEYQPDRLAVAGVMVATHKLVQAH